MLKTVLLVNYTDCPITKSEQKLIEEKLGANDVDYIVSRPQSIEEHLENCIEIQPDLVLFGISRTNVLDKAVGAGYLHVALNPITKQLGRISSLQPHFEELY